MEVHANGNISSTLFILTEIKLNNCALGGWAEWQGCPEECGSHVDTRKRVINGEYNHWETFRNGHYMSVDEKRRCPFVTACPTDDVDDY